MFLCKNMVYEHNELFVNFVKVMSLKVDKFERFSGKVSEIDI